ncbi:MAG: tyrosine-type recombinase/integrase [Thermoplasmatales archaeon]|nr:tyrosine-type recombinase/integrase [Thermoplasmatales archaeon]
MAGFSSNLHCKLHFEPAACSLGGELGGLDLELDLYLKKISLKIESRRWLKNIEKILQDYLASQKNGISKERTINYLIKLKTKDDVETFRKKAFQIRKFLRYLKIDWADEIEIPKMKHYSARKITIDDIRNLINEMESKEYKGNKKIFRALILLGATSGLRAEELYKLNKDDIDLANRIVYVRAGNSKTKRHRISFFSREAQAVLRCYFKDVKGKPFFSGISKHFRKSKIRIMDLRKFFSQEWDRRNGNYFAKRILMGHSLRDVDAEHYAFMDENDLKKIYDEVMADLRICE